MLAYDYYIVKYPPKPFNFRPSGGHFSKETARNHAVAEKKTKEREISYVYAKIKPKSQ